MRYKCIDKQSEVFIFILKQNKDLMMFLDYITDLNLPNCYIAAGSIYQTIWNYYDNKDLNYEIKDIDIIYYDKDDLSVKKDLVYYQEIKKYVEETGIDYEIDVSNEARMHLWKKENENKHLDQYKSSKDAIDQWIATVQSVGITKENVKLKYMRLMD